jgi:hypothetical protein
VLLPVATSLGDSLPQLNDRPWTGWFAGYECRDFRFGVGSDGVGILIPIDKRKKEPVSQRYWIKIEPVVEEVKDDGKVVTKKPADDGWTALTEATAEGGKIGYRGTVAGGATFEVHFETDRDTIRAGGRLLERGELTGSPIRLAIRVKVPNVYFYVDDEEKVEDLADGDRIRLEMADGKKLTFNGWDPVWAEQETGGSGVRAAGVKLEGYDKRELKLGSDKAGLFEFWNGEKRPLHKGFTLGWKPDPEKDPEGKARFTIEFG